MKPVMHTDFDSTRLSGFFCMKLAGFILDNKADYWDEMEKAQNGNCSFKNDCPIYERTLKRHGTIQQKLNF